MELPPSALPPDRARARNGPVAFAGAPVLVWPDGSPAPELPEGAAGISVRVRKRATDSRGIGMPRMVAVDDRLMWLGIGRAVVVTTPGTHVVEVRDQRAESVRRVETRAGEITAFDFWTPASGSVDGVLVRAPAKRRPGAGKVPWLVLFAGLALTGLVPLAFPVPARSEIGGALLLVTVLAIVVHAVVKRGADRRARVRASYEAGDPPSPEDASFLADADAPEAPSDGSGLLMLTATLERDYGSILLRTATHGIDESETWIPWPKVTIDGRALPSTWRTWAYRVTPGEHELSVTVDPPRGTGLPAVTETRRLGVSAGEVVPLSVEVAATVRMADAVRDGVPGKRVEDVSTFIEIERRT